METTFPEDTATITLDDGFPRVGYLTELRADDTALYYFPGDSIAGGGFECWLTAEQASDAEAIIDQLTIDDEGESDDIQRATHRATLSVCQVVK